MKVMICLCFGVMDIDVMMVLILCDCRVGIRLLNLRMIGMYCRVRCLYRVWVRLILKFLSCLLLFILLKGV